MRSIARREQEREQRGVDSFETRNGFFRDARVRDIQDSPQITLNQLQLRWL